MALPLHSSRMLTPSTHAAQLVSIAAVCDVPKNGQVKHRSFVLESKANHHANTTFQTPWLTLPLLIVTPAISADHRCTYEADHLLQNHCNSLQAFSTV